MAGPYSERQELEDLRKLKRLEELEAKAAGRSVSAPPQAAPTAPASPFLQRAAGMLPEGTQPVFPAGAQATPVTGKQAALDARNEQIRTRQDLTGKALKAVRDVQDIQRKRRVEPVERAAGQAGRAQLDQGPVTVNPNVYLGPGSEFMLPPDAQRGMQAEREVYRANDVTSSVDAATIRALNALALGAPGILSKDFRGELAAAGEDQPGAAIAGDLLGFLAPGAAGWSAGARGVNALASRFIPRGADAASRTVRYAAPLAGQVAGAAAQNAAFQAGVQEPIRAETAGEDLTLGGMAAAAKRGLEDPLNLIPLGLSGINRTWNQLTSGIATPSARAADMANRYGVGPRQTAASQGIAQTTQQLGGQLQGADIRGLTNIENALRFALRDNPNVPDVNARIATGFQRIRESLPLEDDPTLNLARLIEREFAPDAPQTRDIIRNFLRGVGLNSPGGGQIVGDAANRMRGQQADVLRTELESSFGAQPKTEANAAIQQSLDQFSAAYNTVLGAAPRQGPQVERALELLAREPQSAAILDDIAQSQNLTAEQFIERNPLEALHVVQSELATQARAMAARGDASAGPLEITVRNMQRPLRDAVPGYGDLQGLWRQWTQARERMGYVRGAAAGTGGELTTVPGFGDKIFGPGGIAKSEMGTQTAADLYLQMDDLSQRAAGLSVRDVINDELRKAKAAGLEERYQTAANMRKVATEGGLDALRRVFGEAGDRVARRIEQFIDANEFARNIDPEFNSATMNKAQAMATGAQPFASGLGQRAQGASNAMTESAVADAVLMLSGAPPIISAMRAPGIVGRLLQPGQRTQRNIASTLLRRGEIGSQVPPRPSGPAPITPINPAMVPGARLPPGGPPAGSTPPASGTPPQAPRTVGAGPAMAAPVMPPPAPAPSPAPAPARSGPPPFPPPLETMEWTGPIPREPAGLLAFIRKLGGIKEEFGRFREQGYMSGSVAQMLGDVRSRPGLLNNQTGQTIDELARSARDAGFDIRDDEDFMRQLADELQGRGKTYRIGEAEEWNIYQEFLRDKARAENSERIYDEIPFGFGRTDATNALAGGTLGGIAPAETPEERARNVAVGAGLGYVARPASQAVDRVSDRVLGSGSPNLKGVDKKRQAYTFDVGGAKAKVTFEESFPDDGDYPRRVPTDIARLREDVRQEYLTPRQALDRSVEAIVPDRYNRGALGPAGPTRTLQDSVNVEMDISNANLTLPQTKQLFEKTFDTLEDHAIRHRRPVYYFTGAKPSQQTLYENSIKRRGAPKGYVATTGPDGFYFVRNDLFPNFAKELQDNGYDVITRTVGAGPASAAPIVASGLPGLRTDATNAALGAGMGALGPAETPEERARNIVVGAGLGYGGTRLGAMGRRTVGAEPAPANMPRTPRDAMRFETPGSPEYEAALAKGLDMSQAGRRQRGIDQGYDMDRVLYHGTIDDFEAFDPQKSEAKFGVHVGTSRAAGDRARAKGEMEAGRRNNWQKGGNADPLTNQQVIPIVAKFKKPLRLPDLGAWTPSSVANAIAKQYGIRPASNRPADVMNAIRKAGYDSIVYKNVSEGRGSDSYIIFDPAEIRSVNAVFDPDNAASPVLTAGSGGYFNRQSMRLPGVGPTAREAELAETWRETRPIVQTARTAASSGEQAADIAVQSRAPGDIARAKDAKAALIREIETAQALRAGMDTPEDARLADALEALKENTSDPLLISSQIGAAKTSLERLLTDLGRPTMPSTMMRAPQRPPLRRTFSAEEEARLAPETPEPPSRTRYAEGEVPPVKGMGFGASEPPKPVRAARAAGYEGTDRGESAEWLSAVRKGLRMDTESRMARAKEMGFDTDTVLYHGTASDFEKFSLPEALGGVSGGGPRGRGDGGVWFTTSPNVAADYASTAAGKKAADQLNEQFRNEMAKIDALRMEGKIDATEMTRLREEVRARLFGDSERETYRAARQSGEGSRVLPVVVRGKLLTIDGKGVRPKNWEEADFGGTDPVLVGLPKINGKRFERWSEFRDAAQAAGYDGIKLRGMVDAPTLEGKAAKSDNIFIFDPSNIRSVNAAFDPDKAGSSTLLAAAPFAAVGGAGLTLAGEDARNQRTVGKPKASQSARTVGKAKTN